MVVALQRGVPLAVPPGAASQLRAWASRRTRSTVSPRHRPRPRRCGVGNRKQLRTGGAEGISTGPPPHLAVRCFACLSHVLSCLLRFQLVVPALPRMLPCSSPASEIRCSNSTETTLG